MSSGLGWYLDEIGRVPLLTPAEELHLGALVRAWQDHPAGPDQCPAALRRRGLRARDRFVRANLRLVVSYVSKRCHRLARTYGTEDLAQAGNIGLITAVERFDPARGYRFSTYAYWWIRQSVNRWVDQHGRAIAIPGSHCQHLSKLAAVTKRLERELNRSPTYPELAAALGISVRVLEQVIENGRSISSLDQVVSDDGMELGAIVATHDRSPEDEEEQRERLRRLEQLQGLIARLAPQDRKLLSAAWGLDGIELSRAELAAQEGISVRALEIRLDHLQQQLASQSIQLVLVAVQRVATGKRQYRRRHRLRNGLQLELMPVAA
jgi:RNA polymerase sigma factor (sigma-70 family)